MKETLQIRGRELTGSEAKYIEGWLSMGFGPEAIAIAYDRTMLSTGRLTWKYMDTILRSWAEKRLFSPEAIESGDPRRASKQPSAPQQEQRPAADSEKLARMRRMYEHMKGGTGNGA